MTNENIQFTSERVLIFAPTGRDAEVTCSILQQSAVNAQSCRDMSDVVHKTEDGCGAIVVAEEALGTTSVQTLTQLLSRQPSWSEIPICIIASGGGGNGDTSRRLALFGSTGNVTVLERPFRPETLVNTLQVALRSRRRQYQVRDLLEALAESESRYRLLAASLESQVKQRTVALEETNKELEAFTYTIAHDLRAPLRAQQGFATAILEEFHDVLTEQGRDYAKRIIESAERLNELVQDLLTFSRISRVEMVSETLDLKKLTVNVCHEMEFQIKEANAKIDLQNISFLVRCHEATFRTAVTNLIANAIKFSRPPVSPRVRIWAEERGPRVRLWVEDNGIGVAPEHHHQIFGVFNRLHKVGEYPGTGIGLAIVQKGIERMGGNVGVESAEGAGSRFWIELPKAG